VILVVEGAPVIVSEKPHSKFLHLYAIVRIDMPVSVDNPENCVSVVKVLASRAIAEKEASRLRDVNRGKRCAYHVYTTRMIP